MLIPNGNLKNENGFTLIETLIAMVILAVALLGIAQMQLSAMRGNRSSYDLTEASAIASDIIEQMVIMSWIEEKAGYTGATTVACPVPVPLNYTVVKSKITYTWACGLGAGAIGQRLTTVTVTWQERNSPHTLVVNSLL